MRDDPFRVHWIKECAEHFHLVGEGTVRVEEVIKIHP
jgi:hypothetical protein